MKTVNILGIPVHHLTMQQATEQIMQMVSDYGTDPHPRYVATVNVDFLVNTWGWLPSTIQNRPLLEALRQADLVSADGMPLVWFSRWMGQGLPERVTGADLTFSVSYAASQKGYPLYLLGGAPGEARACAERLKGLYPGLRIAGVSHPMIDLATPPSTDDKILEEIHKSGAKILLLGLGNPKQELWFQRIKDRLKIPVTLGVGGSFRFVTGQTKRAPAWMQRSGLEWLYRLAQEPSRLWKRYGLGIPKFLCMATPALFRHYTQPKALKKGCVEGQGWVLPSTLSAAWVPPSTPPEQIDFSQVQHIDIAGAGKLFEALRQAPANNVSPKMRSWLRANRMADLIQEGEKA